MFCGCESLKSMVNFSNWNVSKVKNMSEMFSNCKLIKKFPNFNKCIAAIVGMVSAIAYLVY